VIAQIEECLRRNHNVAFTARVHPGARHGYALPDRDIHDRQAAETDWTAIFAMFRRQLG
jgi:carboxymethylenebutenolidase